MPATISGICGAMFSGKTWELINRLRMAGFARKKYLCIKPTADTRNDHCISARDIDEQGNDVVVFSRPAITVDDPWEIIGHLERARPHILAIDEVHLFKPTIIDVITVLRDRDDSPDLEIIFSGLDMDYRRQPFMNTALLMAMADQGVTKPIGACMKCGAKAAYTQAMHPMASNTQVGSRNLYEIRCRACHSIT